VEKEPQVVNGFVVPNSTAGTAIRAIVDSLLAYPDFNTREDIFEIARVALERRTILGLEFLVSPTKENSPLGKLWGRKKVGRGFRYSLLPGAEVLAGTSGVPVREPKTIEEQIIVELRKSHLQFGDLVYVQPPEWNGAVIISGRSGAPKIPQIGTISHELLIKSQPIQFRQKKFLEQSHYSFSVFLEEVWPGSLSDDVVHYVFLPEQWDYAFGHIPVYAQIEKLTKITSPAMLAQLKSEISQQVKAYVGKSGNAEAELDALYSEDPITNWWAKR
jgi:hypothetical protein